jgi:hypothetical protein
MHRSEIHELAVELSQSTPGSSQYLSAYKAARSQVERKFSESQRQKYKAMAKEWSNKKLPPRMQQRYVHMHSNDSRVLELTDCFALV